jgi:hypothetical protein
MGNFRKWLEENEYHEEGRLPSNQVVAKTFAPQQTQVAMTAPDTDANKTFVKADANSTKAYDPSATTDFDYHHDHSTNRLLNIMKTKIDALTWDYGKDMVETAFDSISNCLPHIVDQCKRLKGIWKQFKDALYRELKENAWQPARTGSPNPVVYDSALMRLKDLERIFGEMKEHCHGKEAHNRLFLTFLEEYNKLIPEVKTTIEKFRQNTPRL